MPADQYGTAYAKACRRLAVKELNLLSIDQALAILKGAEESAKRILKQKRCRSTSAEGQCKAVRAELCALRRAFSKKVGVSEGIALQKPCVADSPQTPVSTEKRATELQRKVDEQEVELRQLRQLTCRQGIVDAIVACFPWARMARMTMPKRGAHHSCAALRVGMATWKGPDGWDDLSGGQELHRFPWLGVEEAPLDAHVSPGQVGSGRFYC